jgi:hypothetical protein
MSVEITHVRFSGTQRLHEAITNDKWRNEQDNTVGNSDKPTMVDWIENQMGIAHIGTGSNQVNVGTVQPAQGQPYLRTYSDGNWTNNLVNLPTF